MLTMIAVAITGCAVVSPTPGFGQESTVRGWIKTPVTTSIVLDNDRHVPITASTEVFAPDGTKGSPSDIRPNEPVMILLDHAGAAAKVIRWNEEGVVLRLIDGSSFRDSGGLEWNDRHRVALGSSELSNYITADLSRRAATGVILNEALFDTISFDAQMKLQGGYRGAQLTFLRDSKVLFTTNLQATKRSPEVDLMGHESVEVKADPGDTRQPGFCEIFLSRLTFKRYAWRTPKPRFPPVGHAASKLSLQWQPVTGADSYLAEVQRIGGEAISGDPARAFRSQVVRDTAFEVSDLPIGSYRWRVSSLKSGAIWGHAADWRVVEVTRS